MTDEEYLFKQTEIERKRNGRGTFNKVRQGGKLVRMPSDNLSKKELRAMNGEVKTYNFSKPLKWKQFQAMPKDLRQQYLDMVCDNYYGIPNVAIAESFGVGDNVLNPYLSRNGLKLHRYETMTKKRFMATDAGDAWAKWHSEEENVPEQIEESAETEAQNEKQIVVKTEKQPEKQVKRTADMENIAVLLSMLVGTGAKLTIEIQL